MRLAGTVCSAVTSRGYRCINKPAQGGLCPGHDPRNWCGAKTVAGGQCKRRAASDGGPCSKHNGII